MAGSIVSNTQAGKGRGIVRIDALLTCAGGAVTAQVAGSAFGRIVGILFDPAAGAGATMTSTADITIADALTGAPLIADLTFGTGGFYRPTAPVVTNAGAAITPATTANDVNRDIFVAGKFTIAIANATTTDTGLVSIFVDEGN